MSNVNALLSQRMKKGEQSSKMAEMAKRSADGNLTGFSGIFSVTDLNEREKNLLEAILRTHAIEEENVDGDLNALISITSEVKAINNQAAILHGERIKKAHGILTRYRDGAFTSWLIAAYGNRQTPYNFMQYYEFYEAMPKPLRLQIEAMPRQAVYTLASREGPFDKKKKIVENYNGETKAELLEIIRATFPLGEQDRRKQDLGEALIQSLKRMCQAFNGNRHALSKVQKGALCELIDQLRLLVNQSKTS